MPLTLLDLEKVNQMMTQQSQPSQQQTSQTAESATNNMNYLLHNNINKSNLFANALLQQFQQNQTNLNNKLLSNNLLLNCIQANAQLLSSQGTENQKQINYSRYKTELCRQFIENGECKYGDKCQFAHGMEDLKDVNRHPKYKTDYCKTFHSKGFCPYGPRCHFIHELHEKFDPSIQNVSTSKSKTKSPEPSKPIEDTQLIDKQFEAIQAQLASTLFVSEDSHDNFTVNDSKNQLIDSGSDSKQNNIHSENSNGSFSSGPSSPVTSSISSNSASSYNSSSNSASVSSSTSPVNRVFKKPGFQEHNFYKNTTQIPCFDNTIKNIFDGANERSPRSTSPLTTPRTRSSTSSTSSACSSSSSSSFEFNQCDENNQHININTDPFSPVKQIKRPQNNQVQRGPFNNNGPNVAQSQKNLGPIGRPTVSALNNVNSQGNQNLFDIERINNLLQIQQSQSSNFNAIGSSLKTLNNLNTQKSMQSDTQKSFFPSSSEFTSYNNQFYQNSGW